MKKKKVELPLIEPMYATYHNQGPGSAVLVDNPSIRNWYLSYILNLTCNRKFLHGYTTPELNVANSGWYDNPYFDKRTYPMQYLGGHINSVIKNLLDAGYYVHFNDVDDYYVEGKSWYHERHFKHDGCICGYNKEDKTYCLYAYDSNWVYQKFWTSQKSFNRGREQIVKNGSLGHIHGIKPLPDKVEFLPDTALKKIEEYMNTNMERYPETGEGTVYGIVVHDYIAKYVGKLYDGSIPYERMDRRVFRLIWEHKKVMLERIQCIEKALSMSSEISTQYETVVSEANAARMLYASHHKKQRNSILPIIQKKLLSLKAEEERLLRELVKKSKEIKKNDTVETH